MRARLIVVCFSLMLACATSPAAVGRDSFNLGVENLDWSLTRVQVYCDGSRLGTVTDMPMGFVTYKRIFLRSSCKDVYVQAIGIGGVSRYGDSSYPVRPGECVRVRVVYPIRPMWTSSPCAPPHNGASIASSSASSAASSAAGSGAMTVARF